MRLFTATAFLLGFISFNAIAEEMPLFYGEDVIVTATRFKQKPGDNVINVDTITEQQIKQSTALTLPELLSQHAGIRVRNSDGTQDMAIDMRGFGMTGNQNTLVLINGLPLNDIDLSAIRFSAIPLEAIERIEIMRGSGSVLYGSGATGGTINLITKAPLRENNAYISGGAGNFGTHDFQSSVNLGKDNVWARLTASDYASDNYRANNRNTITNLDGDLRWFSESGYINLKVAADHQTTRFPGVRRVNPTTGINEFVHNPRGATTPNDYAIRGGANMSMALLRNIGATELAGELNYREKNQKSSFESFGGSYIDTDLSVLSFTPRMKVGHALAGAQNNLIAGLDLANWDYDSLRGTTPQSLVAPTGHVLATQKNRAIFVQNTANFSTATQLLLGGRVQKVHYAIADAITPATSTAQRRREVHAHEVALRQQLNQAISIYGKLGRSFRFATIDETYDFGTVTLLEPQVSRDREVGFNVQTPRVKLRVSAYQMDLTHEIHFNALTFTNTNLSPTRHRGLELDATWNTAENLNVYANYTHTQAKFKQGVYGGVNVSGNDIPLVPRHSANAGASWRINQSTQLNGAINYVGQQRFDNDQANTFNQKIPAYTTVDLKLTHTRGALTLGAAINNLLDEEYFTYGIRSATQGVFNVYPMRGRSVLVSANYRFR